MNDEVDGADGTHIDRRTLLKRAGAAGALGLAAPITFDSFFSPAAACSGAVMTVANIHAGTWGSGTDSESSSPTLTVTPVSTTGVVFVAFNIRWTDVSAAPTPTFTSSNLSTFNLVGQIEYQTIGTPVTERLVLYLYRATPTSTTGQPLTVNFGTGQVDNFEGSVFQITAPATLSVGAGVTNSGNSTTAEASVSTSATDSAVVMAVGQNRNNAGGGQAWTPPAGTTEIHDNATNDGNLDISIGTFFRTPVVAPLTVTSIPGAGPWGAIAVEVDC